MSWIAPSQQLKGKTHCVRGHSYDEGGIYRKDDGYRRCLACKRMDDNAYNATRRERAAA